MILNKSLYICLILISISAFAQQNQVFDSINNAQQLDEVKITTATRTERIVSSIPLPITIITAETIARSGVSRLNEILNEQTGIILIPDESGFEGFQMQGLDAAYTMVLIDGVPLVGRISGVLDLSRVSVGNIDRIEIVKGASSALYGSEAMGGVINVITKRPKKDLVSGTISYRYGTFISNDINTNIFWKKKKFSTNLFANYYSSDGYDLDVSTPQKNTERFYNSTINPKVYYDFSDNFKLTISNRFFHQYQYNYAVVNNEDYKGDAYEDEWNSQLKIDHKWNSKIFSEYELYATNYKNKSFLNDSNNIIYDESFYNQWLFRPEIRTTFSVNNDKITTGIGVNHETLNRSYFDKKVAFNSQYFFLQYDYNPNRKINVIAGFRYDNHSQYASQLSPKLAMNYKFNSVFSIKTSVGYGYKAPDFRQLFFDFTNPQVGYTVLGYNVANDRLNELDVQGQLLFRVEGINFNTPLKAESGINYNLGTYFKKNKTKIEFNAFYNSISNLIDTQVVAQKTNGQNIFSYTNFSKIVTYGFEFNTNYNFTKNFSVSVGYQYLIAKDESVLDNFQDYQFVRNNDLQTIKISKSDYFGLFNRSKHTANLKALYTITKLKTDINLRVFYRSKYGLFDTNGNSILDKYDDFVKEYVTANFSISKRIQDKVTFQIGSNNVLNFTNPDQISNLTGRQLYVRVQYNF